MRTPEQQRAANLAKQKRFRRQHPGYKYRHDPLHLRKCPDEEYQASYRTFELADPRDPDMLPRVIGYARTDVAPAWDGLWSVRYLSRSRWAAWLRELETLRLKPVVRPFCTLGAVLPIGHVAAHRIVQLRLQTINEAFTGNRFKAPDWVLRNLEALDVGAGTVATPVGCLFPDGTIGRYARVGIAAKANQIGCEVQLRHRVWSVQRDTQGRLWWDD